jgi:hypothetical protein
MALERQDTSSQDRDVEHRLAELLARLHMPSLRRVQFEASSHEVVLRGEVHSYYAKQVVEHAAQLVADRRRVISEVSVSPERPVRSRTVAAGLLLGALSVGLISGCGKAEPEREAVHPVSGKVLFDGKPAAGAFVVFHPAERDKFPPPTATVDAQGNYSLSTYVTGDGAPAGEYTVTAVLRTMIEKNGEFMQGPNVLPPKYAKPATSTISARVADGANAIPITITR